MMASVDVEQAKPNVSTSTTKSSGGLLKNQTAAIIFCTYVTLFIAQGLLVTASKNEDGKFDYSPAVVVFMTELTKLITCTCIYLKSEGNISQYFEAIKADRGILLLYFVPASLYALYNNLAFVNVAWFGPTTYFILLQLRVVVTGAVFQIVFDQKLTKIQWGSLVLLLFGCVIKNVNYGTSNMEVINKTWGEWLSDMFLSYHFFLIIVQTLCSCFAGVYNEYLLKTKGGHVHIMIQNVYMYLTSLACNLIGFLITSDNTFSLSNFSIIFDKKILLILILNNAAAGIVTSLFLRQLNSIIKTFAASLEIVGTAILAAMLFGHPITIMTVLSICLVSLALYIYAKNPVDNSDKLVTTPQKSEISTKN